MKRLNLVGTLITPSPSSFFAVVMLSVIVVGGSALSFALHNGKIYEYLFGPGSSVELIESSRSSFEVFNKIVFSNPTLNKILFFLFWMLIGLSIYSTISLLRRSTGGLMNFWREMHFRHARQNRLKEDLSIRIVLYSIIIIVWILYSFFFISTLLPFSVLCSRIGINELGSRDGWLYVAAALLDLGLSFHLYVILLRFSVFRPRLFGSIT